MLRHVQQLGLQCALKPTMAAGDARALASEAVREGFETVVAVGGDGTVNEVVNGIADEKDGLLRTRFAVLPVGTVNVFARELGLPLRLKGAWETICKGRETSIDLPQAEYQAGQGTVRRCFAQMGGAGLDARAVELVDWKLKKKIGQFAYVAAGFKALAERQKTIEVIGSGRTVKGQLVLLGNGRLYGGSIPVFHQADLRDGLLDVCVFPKLNWFVVLRYASAYISSKLLYRANEVHFQADSVRLESDSAAPLELDGEHVGRVPATFSVRRQVLRVIAP